MTTLLRLPLAMSSGGLLALGVFAILGSLVDVRLDLGEQAKATRVSFTRQKTDTQIESKRDEKITRTPPPTVVAPLRLTVGATRVENAVQLSRPQFVRATVNTGGLTAGSDRDAIPLVRIDPEYPPRALAREIEGWVQVQFTIAANGSVKDAFVVAADPPSTFDAAALAAIARWRYQPRVEGGVPVERVGLQTVIRFALSDR
jgi:protein TonB